MKLMDFLVPDAIEPNLKSTTKTDSIKELVALLKNANVISDAEAASKVVLDREQLGTTGIGEGIAVPHGKSEAVDKLVAAFGRSEKGVDFDAIDGQPANLLFLLVAPVDSTGPHLMALARISRLLKNRDFRTNLMNAESKSDILKIFESQ
ncbi:PTS sugar transporter subunit IIA [Candidatus Poribacteria bacterium]|nr:PTS sugar transporter subunit IIA [Candidatus Poribacteria bacterium]